MCIRDRCEYYALEGLNQVLKTVKLVKKKMNPSLEMEGVVFTMYDARTNLSLQVVESVKAALNENIYNTITVSYTHLDVYKRQGKIFSMKLLL